MVRGIISAVIPAYNEANTVSEVVAETLKYVDEVWVVDDGSEDGTYKRASQAGAQVIQQHHKGYIQAIKRGIISCQGDVVVTLDADGEHQPSEIPLLVEPVIAGKADLVLGSRGKIPSFSERMIGMLVRTTVPVRDHGTGFRAMTRELAVNLDIVGTCTCGTLVLEAHAKGARIVEVPVEIAHVEKKRKRKWNHIYQLGIVAYLVLLGKK
ncbi:MAG: glycosyltransferase family 2 protein [Theionarchaea archaeon]|nr:glycosyltransferase family 2 protein [Theionarchaea archaeon]MBU7040817.1 glycosyltransferase family 2 protein [Theionarchaea archaeon]